MVIGYCWLNMPIIKGLTPILPITYNPITKH